MPFSFGHRQLMDVNSCLPLSMQPALASTGVGFFFFFFSIRTSSTYRGKPTLHAACFSIHKLITFALHATCSYIHKCCFFFFFYSSFTFRKSFSPWNLFQPLQTRQFGRLQLMEANFHFSYNCISISSSRTHQTVIVNLLFFPFFMCVVCVYFTTQKSKCHS